MRLLQEHDPKYLRLGLILVFTGLLVALLVVTRVNARELSPSVFDTEFLICDSDDPLAVWGADSVIYIYDDLFSSEVDPSSKLTYYYWYGNQFISYSESWGFNKYYYDVIKGHVYNSMSQTKNIYISRYNTVQDLELKEISLDDEYLALYFMDGNFNYYCYVSYVAQNSETVQPEFPFDQFTIDSNGHFVEQDPLYRELFVWDSSSSRWVYSSVSSSEVFVHTILKYKYGVGLTAGADVRVACSRFLIDEPLPTATPTATPTPDPNMQEYHILLNHVNGRYNHTSYMVSFKASGILGEYNQPLNSTVESVLLESGTESTLLKFNASIKKTGQYSGSWLGFYYGTGYIFYIKCSSYSDLKLYKNSNFFASDNFSYIENNYSYTSVEEGNLQNSGIGYDVFYYVSEIDDGYILAFSFKTGEYGNVSEFNQSSDIWFQEGNINSANRTNYFIPFENASDQYKLALNLMFDVENNAAPDPNITPTPTPSPTPTEAPHVIITWPTGTPTPTPPIVIPTSPPFDPPGDGITPLDPELQEDVFGIFKSKIGDNNSFGLFGLLIGLLPGDLMWFIWFLLFVLLVVGVAKLIIHFTGG